jgi:hypothetical protein
MKIAIATAAACLALFGCSTSPSGAARSAPTAPARDGHSVVIAVTRAPSAAAGRVHLTDATGNDSSTSSVILSGAIGDFGTATLDQRTGRFVLHLSRGWFTLQLAELNGRFVAKLGSLSINQSSCSAFAQESGTAPIVSGTGTGSYAHLTGAFALTVTLDEVFHPGGCGEQNSYASQEIITSGWGTVQDHNSLRRVSPGHPR